MCVGCLCGGVGWVILDGWVCWLVSGWVGTWVGGWVGGVSGCCAVGEAPGGAGWTGCPHRGDRGGSTTDAQGEGGRDSMSSQDRGRFKGGGGA